MSAFDALIWNADRYIKLVGKRKTISSALEVLVKLSAEEMRLGGEEHGCKVRDHMFPYVASSSQIQRMILNSDAIRLVKESAIDDFPSSLPSLLIGDPVFIESRMHTTLASSDTDGILILPMNNVDPSMFPGVGNINKIVVITVLSGPRPLDCPGGYIASIMIDVSHGSISKCMGGQNIDCEHNVAREMYRSAFEFVVTFALLWDAEKTPIERGKRSNINPDNQRPYKDKTTVRYVSLTKEYIASQKKQAPIIDPTPLDTSGMSQRMIRVRGHIRNHACGPGRLERKQIFIEPHHAIRWMKDESVTVVTA